MIRKIRKKLTHWAAFKEELKSKSKLKYHMVDLVESILVALCLALVIRAYVVQTSVVPSESMVPTFLVGDRLFVNKFIYRFKTPNRGDITVFKSPNRDGKEYVKRCIGMPGETVQLIEGRVYINGKPLIIAGVTILEDRMNFGPIVVPDAHYFVLGDNRANSQDSRYWGYVPVEDMLGKAWFTFYPLTRMRVLK